MLVESVGISTALPASANTFLLTFTKGIISTILNGDEPNPTEQICIMSFQKFVSFEEERWWFRQENYWLVLRRLRCRGWVHWNQLYFLINETELNRCCHIWRLIRFQNKREETTRLLKEFLHFNLSLFFLLSLSILPHNHFILFSFWFILLFTAYVSYFFSFFLYIRLRYSST